MRLSKNIGYPKGKDSFWVKRRNDSGECSCDISDPQVLSPAPRTQGSPRHRLSTGEKPSGQQSHGKCQDWRDSEEQEKTEWWDVAWVGKSKR